jgi:hypothetical protein
MRRIGGAAAAWALACGLPGQALAQAPTAPPAAAAQAPSTRGNLAAQIEAMKKLDGMVGEWLGDGWFTVEGQRVGIVQSVVVRRELQGQVLTTRDRVQRRTDPVSPPATASFGILSFDDASGRFLMRSYFRGQVTDLDTEVPRPGVLVGRTTRPNGVLARVTTDVSTDGVWHEWSEDSRDGGKTWTRNYDIVMKRLPGS